MHTGIHDVGRERWKADWPGTPNLAGHGELLEGLKSRIRTAQIRATVAVNRELMLLYWQIGREILERQERAGWGAKIIDRLSLDLRRSFPDSAGFSARNLKYMRAFTGAYHQESLVQQVAAQIPWGPQHRAPRQAREPG